ncbi:Hypothetical protein DEACI_0172 [Acididesulfobacillus acetoxydans]|uniref:Uncharacterized protein n=1 Tax=Acididesulfobacillus acetoxydans TaxID=1561005 RepID=A0A8S0XA78_9FIRM|nr:Hypothetical protein DEACI_0172 [Acididesulfobacillus acetoxydans]CEJ07741.1 Hypothetical protein DEACI_2207 [Acididesulfobacillus acetoxydans]
MLRVSQKRDHKKLQCIFSNRSGKESSGRFLILRERNVYWHESSEARKNWNIEETWQETAGRVAYLI